MPEVGSKCLFLSPELATGRKFDLLPKGSKNSLAVETEWLSSFQMFTVSLLEYTKRATEGEILNVFIFIIRCVVAYDTL